MRTLEDAPNRNLIEDDEDDSDEDIITGALFDDADLSDLSGEEPIEIAADNRIFSSLLGTEVLLVTGADQLNILGQTFRPIFNGKVVGVNNGFLTLHPVIIKMSNAPFFRFPTPLQFPLERISIFIPLDLDTRFPLP